MAATVLNVPDISCEHCERRIQQALSPVQGVQSVTVDIPGKRVRVTYNQRLVNVERMKEVLQAEDYPVTSVEGD